MDESAKQVTDGMVIEAVLAGRTERFAVLVCRYEAALRHVAVSRLGRSDWAEDVVQETFLCALKWIHSYDSRYSFRTWLWTILLNQCHRHYRKRMRAPRVQSWADRSERPDESARPEERLESTDPSPPKLLLVKERAELLSRMLQQLPEAQADALRLRFYGGLKFQEIADVMQCSLSTAKSRVRWGLTKLSAMLQEDDQVQASEAGS